MEETRPLTAVPTAGEVAHPPVAWHAMDWPTVHRPVRRLHARLVKAGQAGRGGKVQALQPRLTHAVAANALAVTRVTETPEQRTPGVEGMRWDSPEQQAAALG